MYKFFHHFFSIAGCVVLFLFFGIQSIRADVRQDNHKLLTINMENSTVRQVLTAIEEQSDYTFFYYDNAVDVNRNVTINVTNQPIETVLDQLFKGTDSQYTITDKQVYIRRVGDKVETSSAPTGQQRTLTGTVIDAATNEPLIGVTIRVRGTDTGVVSDIDGNYSIQVGANTQLEFTYVGYKSQVLAVSDLAVLNVSMESADEMLGELVVVGAGTQRKISVTGSINTVKGTDLKLPSSSLTSGLAGKLAGVVSMVNSGEPGAVSEFYIRGISTFGGRTTPLILLDGVEISAGDLDRIPAESIESFSILKDASATAIYGARGANGVMLVTTKSGMENARAVINVSIENSFVSPVNKVKYADGATWMDTYNEALLARSPNASPMYSQERIDNTRSGINPYVYPDVDWYNLVFKDMTMNQRANVNIQGGGSKVTYYMSLQANHDTGLLDIPSSNSFDNNINRWNYTFQNNISYKVTPITKLDLRMNAQIGNNKGPNYSISDLFNYTYNTNPITFPATFPALEGDTHIRFGNAYLSSSRLYTNPLAYMSSSFRETNYNTLNVSMSLEQKLDFITEGLKLTALVNFKNWSESLYSRSMTPWYYRVSDDGWSADAPDKFFIEQIGPNGSDYISQSDLTRSTDQTFYLDTRLDYSRTIDEHSLSAMLMYMQREFRSNILPNRNQGFSGRLTYDYLNKYLAEFNFGYNGTERLAKGNRFEFFPAVSAGWVVSGEDFWEPMNDYIDFLKIRSSYGLVGSDETGLAAGAAHFLYQNEVAMNSGYGFTTGAAGEYGLWGPNVTRLAVEDAHWERVKKFNVGLDIRMFEQLNLAVEFFHDRRDRILMQRASFPAIMGYVDSTPWSNIGKVDNKGIEVSLNWSKQLFNDFTLAATGNFTYTANKFVYKDEPDYPYSWQMDTGKPLSRMTGYIAEGLFKDQAEIDAWPDMSSFGNTIMPGDIKYRDIDGDGRITQEDMVMLSPYGNIPRIQYGFGLNMVYKKFDVGLFFNGSAQRNIMINNIVPFNADDFNGEQNLMKWIADDYWSTSNPKPNAVFPRLGITQAQTSSNTVGSSFWMRNANFLRFKTFELGYRFPYCRVYLNGDNLAVWSPFKLWDPELWHNSYPLSRTFNIGAQFTF